MSRAAWAATSLLLAAFLLAYFPDVGHGLVSDDFSWTVGAQDFLHEPSLEALSHTTNFLRPLVTLSFAFNLALFDHNPRAYGITNLLLALACAVSIGALGRQVALSPAAAVIAAGAWGFNFHGINMSILWISGRTSLLLTLFGLLAAWFAVGRRPWLAALFCSAALFSKEEAIALPFVLAMWVGVRAAWPLFVPLAGYFAIRLRTSAFWPTDAPDYYRFTTSIGDLVVNAAHYLDRGGTIFVVTLLLLMLAARARPRLVDVDRHNLLRGVVWFAGGYALTLWVPVRSSLYAVFPSVGAALMLGAMADAVLGRADARARLRASVVLLALPFLLWPVYRTRNERWRELAELTHAVVPQMRPHVGAMRDGTPVWIRDDDSTRANLRNAFGGQMDSAMRLYYGVAPIIHVAGSDDEPAPGHLVLRLRDGRLEN